MFEWQNKRNILNKDILASMSARPVKLTVLISKKLKISIYIF